MQTTIYLYHIDNQKTLQAIRLAAVRLGSKVKVITDQMAGQKVGYIAGLEGFSDEVSEQEFTHPDEPVMLLKGFSSKKLDDLLLALRTAKIPKIQLKATLTESNQNWYFYDLYEELLREREAFSKQKKEP